MKSDLRVLLAAGSLAASFAASAAGVVDVKFIEREQFSDAGRTTMQRDRNLGALESHLKRLGAGLPDGQKLTVEVLDVDLAGTVDPRRSGEVRVLRGRADWPRITLRYTLEAGGNVLHKGEETVADMSYLNWPSRQISGEELPYEKHMLDEWFKRRFANPQPQ